jgi:two-component system sensor histidine kinase CpxA
MGDAAVESEVRQVTIRLEAIHELELQGDRELLRRAVENVLRNAIRYAPEHSAVEVSLLKRNNDAVISVRDFGPGVPDESLNSLFKPFFRVEADRNRDSGGVGLGLSIAQRAVALHQGNIQARNVQPGLLVEIKLPGAVVNTAALIHTT